MVGFQKRPCRLGLSGLGLGKELRDRQLKPVEIDQHVHREVPDAETHDRLAFSRVYHSQRLGR